MQTLKIFQITSQQPDSHILETLAVLKMVCDRRQGERPRLRLWVPYTELPTVRPHVQKKCRLEFGPDFQFVGILKEIVHEVEDYQVVILFEAAQEPPAQLANFEALCDSVAVDPLFYRRRTFQDPQKILTELNLTVFWPIDDQPAQVIGALEGLKLVPLTQAFKAESFQLKTHAAPLGAAEVVLSAQWVEKGQGEVDVSPKLQRLWPDGVLRTLDPEGLKNRWFKEKPLGQSGYRVVKSQIKRRPELDQSYPVHNTSCVSSAFEPVLVLGWKSRQKREDLARFTVTVPGAPHQQMGVLRLTLGLQDICQDAETPSWWPCFSYRVGSEVLYQGQRYRCHMAHVSGTHFWKQLPYWTQLDTTQAPFSPRENQVYFFTERGQKSLHYALRLAEARLQHAWLNQELSLVCGLETGLELNEQTLVCLTDDRLPHGKIVGKVKTLTHIWDPNALKYESHVVVRCGSLLALDQVPDGANARLSLWPQQDPQPRTLVSQSAVQPDPPKTADLIVQQVKTENMAPEQWQKGAATYQNAPEALWPWISKQYPTDVSLELADLHRAETLTRQLEWVPS